MEIVIEFKNKQNLSKFCFKNHLKYNKTKKQYYFEKNSKFKD